MGSSTMTADVTVPPINLELRNIVQEFPAQQLPAKQGQGVTRVLDGINLAFNGPGINMLLGPSGCGKSTLLHMMGGVRPNNVVSPTSGQVFINGQLCDGPHDDAIMVFQRYANRPDLTVYQNVALPFRFGLWKSRVPKAEWMARVDNIIAAVGLQNHKNHYPAQLSGGQNQRVALARALVLRPRILLMDEPFGALDAQTRTETQALLNQLYKENPCLIIFVTHDVTEALLLGDRVVVLSTQPARIADDFAILEPRPRDALWQRSKEAVLLEERILDQLHSKSPNRSQLSVTI